MIIKNARALSDAVHWLSKYEADLEAEEDSRDPGQRCRCPGHEWAYTGSAYGGDDDSYHGEGRCYCVHCGADGDA